MWAEVWFLDNGYRKAPPYGDTYRPHLVVEDTNEYLGVEFEAFEKPLFNEHIICRLKLPYEGVDYSELHEGVMFEVREGPHTVGKGSILKPKV
jgi:hypothetical protein